MKDARTLAAAALIALLAGGAHAQSAGAEGGRAQGGVAQTDEAQTDGARAVGAQTDGARTEGTQGGSGQSELAPDEAATPAERPEETPLAPAETAPAPAPRPEEPAPETAPAPTPEPEAPAQAPAPEEGPEAPAQGPVPEEAPDAPATAPVPDEDPDAGAEAPAEAPQPTVPPVPEQLAEGDAVLAACLGQLRALGAVFEEVGAVSDQDGTCGIVNPISLAEIVPGVALEPAGVMRCATGAALADWVATFVLPASRILPERGRLVAVEHGSAYLCRGIGGGGELSQHAFGNAVDVMAFRFSEGPAIPVEPREREGSAAAAFQRTARASACLLFTTVIGPGQADHDDHLHLDIEARESGHRLCQ